MSKQGSFSEQNEKSKDKKNDNEAPEDEETKTNLHRGTDRIEIDL